MPMFNGGSNPQRLRMEPQCVSANFLWKDWADKVKDPELAGFGTGMRHKSKYKQAEVMALQFTVDGMRYLTQTKFIDNGYRFVLVFVCRRMCWCARVFSLEERHSGTHTPTHHTCHTPHMQLQFRLDGDQRQCNRGF